jgi:hypothetical protein
MAGAGHRVTTAGTLLAILLSAAAQPARGDQSTIAAATASISGVVTTDDSTGRPIARAIVTLRSPDLQPGLQVVTDEAGGFVFSALRAGTFTVTASKPSFLPIAYGQATAERGSALPMSLDAGEQLAGVTLALSPGSVISGRVTDDAGQPLVNAPILVMHNQVVNGERTLTTVGGVRPMTDARGMYRAWGLPPGEYVVCAYPPGGYLAIPQDCQQEGSTEDAREVTRAEIGWARQQLQLADTGVDGTLAGTAPASPPPPGQTMAYGPVFYPGASTPATAVPITLGRGEERAGIDLTMSRHPTARIAATVIGPDGRRASGIRVSFFDGFGTLTVPAPDGTFSMSGLRPGVYTLSARVGDASGTMDIAVDGRDLVDLVLPLHVGGVALVALTGHTVFDGTTLTRPANLSGVRVTLVPEKPGNAQTTTALPDGTFTISSVQPGRYRLQVSLAGQPAAGPIWHVKSAELNGHDASDAFVDLATGASEVIVTFTDHPSELSGQLLDASGRPAPGYYIVVFSTDKRFWRQGARRLPAPARAATDGSFRFSNLPSGSYYLAALTEIDPAVLYDETFLSQLATAALSIDLSDGERRIQNLTIGPAR